jgi:hypothetical protein
MNSISCSNLRGSTLTIDTGISCKERKKSTQCSCLIDKLSKSNSKYSISLFPVGEYETALVIRDQIIYETGSRVEEGDPVLSKHATNWYTSHHPSPYLILDANSLMKSIQRSDELSHSHASSEGHSSLPRSYEELRNKRTNKKKKEEDKEREYNEAYDALTNDMVGLLRKDKALIREKCIKHGEVVRRKANELLERNQWLSNHQQQATVAEENEAAAAVKYADQVQKEIIKGLSTKVVVYFDDVKVDVFMSKLSIQLTNNNRVFKITFKNKNAIKNFINCTELKHRSFVEGRYLLGGTVRKRKKNRKYKRTRSKRRNRRKTTKKYKSRKY